MKISLLHIAQATAEKINESKISRVALLGTKYTMTQDFYKEKLVNAGIEVLIPELQDIERVNDIIYKELCLGVISESSKAEFLRLIEELDARGVEGVILGCTEIGLLVTQKDIRLPVFDTTIIHATAAALRSI